MMIPLWWAIATVLSALVIGFGLGVWQAGRTLVPLYHERIYFLERQLAERHVDVEPSV